MRTFPYHFIPLYSVKIISKYLPFPRFDLAEFGRLKFGLAEFGLLEVGLAEFGLLKLGLAEFGVPELGLVIFRDRLVTGGETLSGISPRIVVVGRGKLP